MPKIQTRNKKDAQTKIGIIMLNTDNIKDIKKFQKEFKKYEKNDYRSFKMIKKQGEDNIEEYCELKEGDFEIGQCYEETPAKTLICKKCKSKKFIVGQGNYFTAIKCEKCEYEICIHEG